ncbi:phenylalanine--tRNA ligase subunit alpha [Sediminitomix flava]|uniref:Phenylalanine--tRNA ligase alpha subunit n=1 Tax=Sediminitomix flava TaxID=379075 RepID=A0A315Z2L2_SEDFL|nr:phenylalanine--tRNA ligase subunit alpha [Sediminitomix flava]PWJ36026.1 phenylalanyl-tRNA synthetase alpha subunit [Sediminitomix flava]
MLEQIEKIAEEIAQSTAANAEELEAFRMRFISRKSVIGDIFGQMKNVAPEERKEFGQKVNMLKNAAQDKFKELVEALESASDNSAAEGLDLTLPNIPHELGSVHPITKVRAEINQIFERIGFNISEGPEIEDDWHNFTALNFPPNHPAREMQDTFFLEKDPDIALRTHTSSVQVRVMENQEPPIRTLSPGRVYRNETISARAHCIFHQVEGLYIDKNVSFKDLKDTLYYFAKELFGPDTKIRLRPSYFPFTEPSAELDVSCNICGGKGCNICKYTGWVEIGGCGMVDPNVLEASGIDPDKYTGFAFGMGIERITMLKYRINDLRLFTENDVRFLRQFSSI